MANPYNMQMGYQSYPQQAQYQQAGNNKSIAAPALAMATLGALTGGTIGYIKSKNPISQNGEVSDSFARQAFENHAAKNFSNKEKTMYKQFKELGAKLDKVKDTENLKQLLEKNKEAIKKICEETKCNYEEFVSSITSKNWKATKKALKERLNMSNNLKYQQFKNFAEKCWDEKGKCFTKPEGFSKEIFDVIKNTKTSKQWKKALKYGGITAGVLGALTIGYRMAVSQN